MVDARVAAVPRSRSSPLAGMSTSVRPGTLVHRSNTLSNTLWSDGASAIAAPQPPSTQLPVVGKNQNGGPT